MDSYKAFYIASTICLPDVVLVLWIVSMSANYGWKTFFMINNTTTRYIVLLLNILCFSFILYVMTTQFLYWQQFWEHGDYITIWQASRAIVIPYMIKLLSPSLALSFMFVIRPLSKPLILATLY